MKGQQSNRRRADSTTSSTNTKQVAWQRLYNEGMEGLNAKQQRYYVHLQEKERLEMEELEKHRFRPRIHSYFDASGSESMQTKKPIFEKLYLSRTCSLQNKLQPLPNNVESMTPREPSGTSADEKVYSHIPQINPQSRDLTANLAPFLTRMARRQEPKRDKDFTTAPLDTKKSCPNNAVLHKERLVELSKAREAPPSPPVPYTFRPTINPISAMTAGRVIPNLRNDHRGLDEGRSAQSGTSRPIWLSGKTGKTRPDLASSCDDAELPLEDPLPLLHTEALGREDQSTPEVPSKMASEMYSSDDECEARASRRGVMVKSGKNTCCDTDGDDDDDDNFFDPEGNDVSPLSANQKPSEANNSVPYQGNSHTFQKTCTLDAALPTDPQVVDNLQCKNASLIELIVVGRNRTVTAESTGVVGTTSKELSNTVPSREILHGDSNSRVASRTSPANTTMTNDSYIYFHDGESITSETRWSSATASTGTSVTFHEREDDFTVTFFEEIESVSQEITQDVRNAKHELDAVQTRKGERDMEAESSDTNAPCERFPEGQMAASSTNIPNDVEISSPKGDLDIVLMIPHSSPTTSAFTNLIPSGFSSPLTVGTTSQSKLPIGAAEDSKVESSFTTHIHDPNLEPYQSTFTISHCHQNSFEKRRNSMPTGSKNTKADKAEAEEGDVVDVEDMDAEECGLEESICTGKRKNSFEFLDRCNSSKSHTMFQKISSKELIRPDGLLSSSRPSSSQTLSHDSLARLSSGRLQSSQGPISPPESAIRGSECRRTSISGISKSSSIGSGMGSGYIRQDSAMSEFQLDLSIMTSCESSPLRYDSLRGLQIPDLIQKQISEQFLEVQRTLSLLNRMQKK